MLNNAWKFGAYSMFFCPGGGILVNEVPYFDLSLFLSLSLSLYLSSSSSFFKTLEKKNFFQSVGTKG